MDERKYALVEKGALSLDSGICKFHQETMITDTHKPLTTILGPKWGIPPLAASFSKQLQYCASADKAATPKHTRENHLHRCNCFQRGTGKCTSCAGSRDHRSYSGRHKSPQGPPIYLEGLAWQSTTSAAAISRETKRAVHRKRLPLMGYSRDCPHETPNRDTRRASQGPPWNSPHESTGPQSCLVAIHRQTS